MFFTISCTATVLEYLTYSFVSFLANCAFVNTDEPSGIQFASLNPAHSFVIRSERSFREGCPRELAHSPKYSQLALNLERILSLLPAQPLEYYSSRAYIAALRLNQYKVVCLKAVGLYPSIVDPVSNNNHGVSC